MTETAAADNFSLLTKKKSSNISGSFCFSLSKFSIGSSSFDSKKLSIFLANFIFLESLAAKNKIPRHFFFTSSPRNNDTKT